MMFYLVDHSKALLPKGSAGQWGRHAPQTPHSPRTPVSYDQKHRLQLGPGPQGPPPLKPSLCAQDTLEGSKSCGLQAPPRAPGEKLWFLSQGPLAENTIKVGSTLPGLKTQAGLGWGAARCVSEPSLWSLT
jgi:hypothetical protein